MVDSFWGSIGVFDESLSKVPSELGLTSSVNINVERKIPKNTEPKIEVVTIKIDLADNYHLVLYSYLKIN